MVVQGDGLCGWNKSGLDYLIILALSEADMEKLEDLLPETDGLVGSVKDVRLNGINKYRFCILLVMPTRTQIGDGVV